MGVKVTYKIGPVKKTATGKNSIKLYSEAFQSSMALVIQKSLAKKQETETRRTLLIIATFFQRLCARTPIDEMYKSKNAPNGVHTPDDDYTRYHWYIKMGNNKPIYSNEMIAEAGFDIFGNYNDEGSIKFIQDFLEKRFKDKTVFQSFYIKNDADKKKFRLLEFGGYKEPKNATIKQGENEKHGIENKHSVQAPAGMLRITKGELSSIAASAAKKPLAYRYRDSKSTKIPSERTLNKIYKTLERDGKFYIKDIKEYLK